MNFDFGTTEAMGSAALLARLRALPKGERNEAAFRADFKADAASLGEGEFADLVGQLGDLGVKVSSFKMSVRALRAEGKKKPATDVAPADKRPVIAVDQGDEWEVNAAAEKALSTLPGLYQRVGQLVRVVESARRRPGETAPYYVKEIKAVSEPLLREMCTKAARWVESGDKAHPPEWCIRALHDWHAWPSISPLYYVAEAPMMFPDGSFLDREGYDPATGILCQLRMKLPTIPEQPTREEARAAADLLLSLVDQFPFENEARRSAWLAALLTPIARWAFSGQSPMFIFDANQPGSGKGLLSKVIGLIVLGHEMDFVIQTENEEEERKRITSKVLSGAPMVLVDNIDKPFGSAAMEALLTSGVWSDRLLNTNDAPTLDAWITWYGSANNIQYKRDDTRRRVCVIRLVTDETRPEERTSFTHPKLEAYVEAERPALYAAALTVLRAWLRSSLEVWALDGWGGTWGSFGDWDRVVRGAIVYAGLADPIGAKGTVGVEAVKEGLAELVEGLCDIIAKDGEVGVGPGARKEIRAETIFTRLSQNDEFRRSDRSVGVQYPTIRMAFRSFMPHLRGDTPSVNQIGTLLGKWKQKPVPMADGRTLRIVTRPRDGKAWWSVEEVPAARKAAGAGKKEAADDDVERAAIMGTCERCHRPVDRSSGDGGCYC